MPNKDAETQKANQRKNYQDNKQRYKDQVKNRRNEIRRWLVEYKTAKGCEECGQNHPAILDFHHEAEKDLCLSAAVSKQWSQKRLEFEVAKCKVLCSNCHRIYHWNLKELVLRTDSLEISGVEEDG
jgi:phosphoenolpyruvate-protein kinase (PTS system EI component)